MPAGIRATPPDRRRVARVVEAVALVNDSLHHHHTLEDDLFWDSLEERRPSCTVHVELMKQHHAAVKVLLDAAPPLLDGWAARLDASSAEAVALHLEEIGALLEVHLTQEERFILPVIGETFTENEWQKVGDAAQKGYARSQIFLFFGLIQDSMTPAELEAFMTDVPRAITLLYRLYGKRAYERTLALLSAGTARPGRYSARPEEPAP